MSLAGSEEIRKRGCEECRGPEFRLRNEKTGDFDPAREQLYKKAWNCYGRNPDRARQIYFDWAPELRECPWGAIPREAWSYLSVYKHFAGANGTLGDILDLPAWVLQLVEICASEKIAAENHLIEKSTKK